MEGFVQDGENVIGHAARPIWKFAVGPRKGKASMGERMNGVLFYGAEEGMKVEEISRPSIKEPNQVSVEIKACGLCGTDVAIADPEISLPVSLLSFILGHDRSREFRLHDC